MELDQVRKEEGSKEKLSSPNKFRGSVHPHLPIPFSPSFSLTGWPRVAVSVSLLPSREPNRPIHLFYFCFFPSTLFCRWARPNTHPLYHPASTSPLSVFMLGLCVIQALRSNPPFIVLESSLPSFFSFKPSHACLT